MSSHLLPGKRCIDQGALYRSHLTVAAKHVVVNIKTREEPSWRQIKYLYLIQPRDVKA